MPKISELPTGTPASDDIVPFVQSGVTKRGTFNGLPIPALVQTELNTLTSTKQDNLVSGTNIKTIQSQSILGSGDVTLDADDISDTTTTNKFATAAEKTKLGHISVTQAVDLDTMESDIATNTAKVTNATHTGDATGATALSVVALRGVSLDSSVGTPSDGDILVYRSAGSDFILEQKPSESVQAVAILNIARDLSDASGTVTYTHSLGTTPTHICIEGFGLATGASLVSSSIGHYANGTTRTSYGARPSGNTAGNSTTDIVFIQNTGTQSATISNITTTQFDLVWTKAGTSSGPIALTCTVT